MSVSIYDTLKGISLFAGINSDDFQSLLTCLAARQVSFLKESIIVLAGDVIRSVGIIVSGATHVSREDVDGRISIITELGSGDVFGEVFACAGITHSPITIEAVTDTEVLFFDYRRIISSCGSACPFHARLIANMLKMMAEKNLMLNQKLEILAKRSTREKLLFYFDTQRGSARKFTIPFNREELANYLCVDRSALSAELGRMRDAGLIRFKHNEFEILD